MEATGDVITFILSLISIVLTALYLHFRRPPSYPPGPFILKGIGTLPFIGNPNNYGELIGLLTKWKSRFGKVVGYSTGANYAVVINDYALAMELLVKNGKYSSDRPCTDLMKVTNPLYPRTGIVEGNFTDTTWYHLRQAGQMALHNFVEMPPRGRTTNRLEGRLARHLDAMQAAIGKGSQTDAQPDTRSAIFDTVTQVIFGIIFGGERKKLKTTAAINASLDALYSLTPDFLNLKNNSMSRVLGRWKSNTDSIKTIYKKFQGHVFEGIGEHQTRENKDQADIHDFINYYLKEFTGIAGKNEGDNRITIVATEIAEHGPDPIASATCWVLYHLVGHPEIQAKIREQIETVVGYKRHPKLKDRLPLALIDAVVSETLRLTPPFPVGLARKTCRKVQLDKYVLPKNTTVFLDLWNIHRDPRIWEEPEDFKPERFLNASGRYLNKQEMIAFGLGRRVCIGEQIARQTLFLIVANLLQRFTFRLPDGAMLPKADSSDAPAATMRPPEFELVIEANAK